MITMRQLEILCAVIDAGSITRASERLYLSQPAVSKIIATLERETGLTLFQRQHRRLDATPEACRLHEEAQRVFTNLTEISRLAEELRSLNSGNLTVGTLAAVGRNYLPSIVARFLSGRPNVNFSYQVRSSNKIMQWAIAQQIDIGIAMTTMEHRAVHSELLCTVDAICVLPPGHPLAARSCIAAEDLEGERFVSFGREGRMRHIIDEVFELRGVQRDLVAETFNSDGACGIVASGLGVSIVEPFSALGYTDGLVRRSFSPAVPYEFTLLYPRFRGRSLVTDAFAMFLKAEIGRAAATFGTTLKPSLRHCQVDGALEAR